MNNVIAVLIFFFVNAIFHENTIFNEKSINLSSFYCTWYVVHLAELTKIAKMYNVIILGNACLPSPRRKLSTFGPTISKVGSI